MTDTTLGADELNRTTLSRQALLERSDSGVVDMVRRVAAIQAQEPAAVHVALWNRISDLDLADVDEAFRRYDLLKSSLMRITLHAVAADDHPAFHVASTPLLRAARLNDDRYRDTGLTTDDADAVVDDLVALLATPASKAEIVEHLAGLPHGSDEPRLWWALRTFAPIVHAPTDTPWIHGREAHYVAPPGAGSRPTLDDALDHLVVRYLAAFGPATAQDVSQFTLQKMSAIRPTIERLDGRLTRHRGPSGEELLDVVDAPPITSGDVDAPPRLLGMWDSILLAYRDRSRVIPEPFRRHVIRTNGDTLATALVDGRVAGVWRIGENGVELSMFSPIDADAHDRLEVEARSLAGAIGYRRPWPFARFDRWWAKLPTDNRTIDLPLG